MCPQECFTYYKRAFWPVLCHEMDWATLRHFSYYFYLSLVTNYLAIKQLVTAISVLEVITLLKWEEMKY